MNNNFSNIDNYCVNMDKNKSTKNREDINNKNNKLNNFKKNTFKKLKNTYSLGEEIFNSVSHGVGTIFAIAAMAIMITIAVIYGNGWSIASAIIYGITMIVLYTMSTLYHAFTRPRVKAFFRILDHCSIFLLIAGTYTPLLLVALNGTFGFVLFAFQWLAAIVGIILNVIDIKKYSKISLILYIVMGWTAVIAVKPLLTAIQPGGLWLILAGGIMYTVGIIFYLLKKRAYMHSIWHLFVLAGSILHFLAILIYVLPINPLI